MSETESDTASATLRCSDGCIEIEYRAVHLADDVDARQFLNELGIPSGMDWDQGKRVCPNCQGGFSVDWDVDQQVAADGGQTDD